MAEFTDLELVRYALGDASAALAAAVEGRARADAAFAGELAALRERVTGGGVPGPDRVAPRAATAARSPWRRRCAAAGVVLAVAGAAWGACAALAERPLLRDDFDRDWIDPGKWDVSLGRPGVRAVEGHLRLRNRGSVVTRQEFDCPIEVEFDWRWRDHAEDPLYAEVLVVGLRTSGAHMSGHSFQLLDGVFVHLSTLGACVSVSARPGPVFEADSPEGGVPMPADAWHHVRITDDGATVRVYLSGPRIDRRYATTPVIAATPPGHFAGRRVAIHNRELVSNATHESHIDNVVIRALRGP
jgi:hypothetical protein